jgi:pyruvate kinase
MSKPQKPVTKLTKIVATIGPATETEEILKELILAGMNVARFNTKHGTPKWHHERILRVKKVAAELNLPVAVLLDLQGPEIRINLAEELQESGFEMKEGEVAYFTSNQDLKKKNLIFVPENALDVIEPGQLILTDDGLCQFEAVKKGNKTVEAVALDSFTVKHRKTMSIPGVVTDMPVLVENDYVQLDGIQNNEVDYVALSFVRDRNDVLTLRRELEKRNLTAAIIAKIENQAALDNLDEIIEVSDGIMVARGDLGVEVPYEELVYWQRLMIKKCRDQAKPVITATHMLETMIDHPLPTRAEISDVAHAIYDLTDAVMLSGETTIGKFPVKAVETQAKIAQFNEKHIEVDMVACVNGDDEMNIAYAAANLLYQQAVKIDAIICISATGATAAQIARNRPKAPQHVITSDQRVYQQLSLYYGVYPHLVDWTEKDTILNAEQLLEKLAKRQWLKSGQKILVLHGPHVRAAGETNTLSIIKVA